MFQKIKNLILAAALVLTAALPALVPVTASAATNGVKDSICRGTNIATSASNTSDTAGCAADTSGVGADGLYTLAAKIVNIFSVLVGIIAVIMIIYGGFKYITSGGDSGNISGAKNTLIYAIIGLVVVALAQFIVRFVLGQANTIG